MSKPRGNAVDLPAELRWTDFDGYGHLHTSAHVIPLENTRAKFLSSVLLPAGGSLDWVLARLSLDYLAEFRRDEGRRITCRVGTESIERSSTMTREALTSPSGRLLSRGQCVVALWDSSAGELSPDQRPVLLSLGVAEAHSERGSR